MIIMRFFKLLSLVTLLSFPQFAFASSPPPQPLPLRIVATFSILQDLVQEIAPNVPVETIVPVNADPHVYQPTPSDVKKLAHADLIFVNGLGFEGWMDRLIQASGFKGKIIVVSKNVQPRSLIDHKTGRTTVDPHAWHDVRSAIKYTQEIVEALCTQDPKNTKEYKKQGDRFIKELTNLHQWAQKQFKEIPLDRRVVVTTHDAFWYFGEAYGIQFLSPVGISTEAHPSPNDILKLINQIRRDHVRAIFMENLSDPKTLQQIAEEAGVAIGGTLYADSLSEKEGPAATYIQMIRHNVQAIKRLLT